MTENQIQELADKAGIARDYLDVSNNLVTIDPKNRADMLRIMGYPIDDQKALELKEEHSRRRECDDILDPVTVLNDKDFKCVYLRTRADVRQSAVISWSIELEDHTRIGDAVPLEEIEIADYFDLDGEQYDLRRFIIPVDLPYGYHHFSCVITDGYRIFNSVRSSLIRCPSSMYMPDEIKSGRKLWGVSVQLYALRSEENWGVGDFNDLKHLLPDLASCGGSFVGLNPVHAGYPASPDPCNVSPYSPSSRQWLNICYISVPQVPEYIECPEACSLVGSKQFQQKLRALRDREYVDYRGVIDLKLQVLRIIFDRMHVDDRRSTRGRKFLAFIEEGGRDLLTMATYGALQADLFKKGVDASGWQAFPRELQQADSPFVEVWRNEHAADVRFYCYLQFLAQEQLDEAFAQAQQNHMCVGIYRDLAVGVAPGSCDVWGDRDGVYRVKASVGAPPDHLGPLGQVWGLAPMDPRALRECAYEPMIRLYRANMRSCGALRIDHAAGLNRFWWVANGHKACDGVYVKSPMHDLIGIIALESVRHKCLIICEDLGTIPQDLRDALRQCGALSYKMFFDERASDGGFISPYDYQHTAMAALTTHDMPTLKGWWNNLDLINGVKMGIYTEQQRIDLTRERDQAKQRMFDSMRYFGSLDSSIPYLASETPFSMELVKDMQVHLCKTSCMMYSSQLEDWIGVEKPVNVPGTMREYPNWRRKLTKNLDEIFSDPFVKDLTSAMTKARNS